jgi:NADPH-dependent ferric siderophore reductase
MAQRSTYRLFDVSLKRRQVLSPALTRMVFTGADVAQMKTEGPDQRIKVFFPQPGEPAPQVPRGEDWYARYRAQAVASRAPMRTYTIRALRPAEGEVDVDFVLHGETGPASRWAMQAQVGDRLCLLAPDAAADDVGEGCEWKPPRGVQRVLLVADETALPAVAGILETLAAAAHAPQVQAIIEVAHQADVIGLAAPPGAQLHWLARDAAEEQSAHGARLLDAVRALATLPANGPATQVLDEVDIEQDILWERAEAPESAFYAWIAGEASTVMAIRRHLVNACHIDRRAITFMGYWRQGRVLE